MDAPPVQYVTTADGHNIAYSVCGEGTPFVLMPWVFNHAQLVWQGFSRPLREGLAHRFKLVLYDGRGQGMSTRGLGEDFSLDHLGRDLEAVVDRLGLGHFVLMAGAYFTHVAVRYAIENPARVFALVLSSPHKSASSLPTAFTQTLAQQDWELFLRTMVIAPDLTSEQIQERVGLLRQMTAQDDYSTIQRAVAKSDISAELALVSVPTLVLHVRNMMVLPAPAVIDVASRIAGSRFVTIEGHSGLGDAETGLSAIDAFLGALPAVAASKPAAPLIASAAGMSSRELEVLRLVAAGRSNQQIADELVISLNTVRRHVSNIFDKAGVANRTEAAAYARSSGVI